MYGLINRAIHDLVIQHAGPDGWERVRAEAGIAQEEFHAIRTYDDEITYQLVAATASELGITPHDALVAFGRYWVLYTSQEGYGPLFDMSVGDTRGFLKGLDAMHMRIKASMPELNPPSFVVHDCDDGSIRLEYHSDRPGLGPLVLGLIEGLGERLEDPVVVTWLTENEEGRSFDEFAVASAS